MKEGLLGNLTLGVVEIGTLIALYEIAEGPGVMLWLVANFCILLLPRMSDAM